MSPRVMLGGLAAIGLGVLLVLLGMFSGVGRRSRPSRPASTPTHARAAASDPRPRRPRRQSPRRPSAWPTRPSSPAAGSRPSSTTGSRPPRSPLKPPEWLLLHGGIAVGSAVVVLRHHRRQHPPRHGRAARRPVPAVDVPRAQALPPREGVQQPARRLPAADGRQPQGRALARAGPRHRRAGGPGAAVRRVQARSRGDQARRPHRGRARVDRVEDGERRLRVDGHGDPHPARGRRKPRRAAAERGRHVARARLPPSPGEGAARQKAGSPRTSSWRCPRQSSCT